MTALSSIVGEFRDFFLGTFGAQGQLRTLGALVSLPGARTQQIHADMDWVGDTLFCYGLVALQDVSLEMGPTVLFAGTHSRSFHELRRDYDLEAGPSGVGGTVGGTSACVAAVDPIDAQPPSPMLLDAGDMVVFDTRTFHHGTENASEQSRMLLSFSFLATGSNPRNVPAYFSFLATPDIAEGQLVVGDFTRGKQATP